MIPITPEIMGPGIEEEYADAMERIETLEVLLKPFPASNDTREGRMVFQVGWLRQEIEAKRLPIPLDRKYWSTLGYLVGEGSLHHLGAKAPMGELARILRGEGLLKPRHWPVVLALLHDFISYVQSHPGTLTALDPIEEKFLQETRQIRDDLASGRATLPLAEADYPGWKGTNGTKHLDAIPDFGNRRYSVMRAVFDGVRPKPCRKGPLPAPNPGMVWGSDS